RDGIKNSRVSGDRGADFSAAFNFLFDLAKDGPENLVGAGVLHNVKRFCQMDLQLVAGGHLLKEVDLHLQRYLCPADLFFFLLPLAFDFENSQPPVYGIVFKRLQSWAISNSFGDFVFAWSNRKILEFG